MVAGRQEIKLFAYIRIEDSLFPLACEKIRHHMIKGPTGKSASNNSMKEGCQGFCHILSGYMLYSTYAVSLQRKRASGTFLWDVLSLALREHRRGHHHHGYRAPDRPGSAGVGVVPV